MPACSPDTAPAGQTLQQAILASRAGAPALRAATAVTIQLTSNLFDPDLLRGALSQVMALAPDVNRHGFVKSLL